MAKLSVTELSGKPVDLRPSPQRVVLFFTNNEKSVLEEAVAESQSHDLEFVGIFIGNDLNKVRTFKKSNPDAKIYKASNLNSFESLGVTDVPWVLYLEHNDPKYSKSLSELGVPIITKLMNNVLSSSRGQRKKTTAHNKDEKIEELEALAESNQLEIELLKKEISRRDEIIDEILEKL